MFVYFVTSIVQVAPDIVDMKLILDEGKKFDEEYLLSIKGKREYIMYKDMMGRQYYNRIVLQQKNVKDRDNLINNLKYVNSCYCGQCKECDDLSKLIEFVNKLKL